MAEDNVVRLLRELLLWTRVGNFGAAKNLLETVLDDEKKRRIYSMLDGKATHDEIRKAVGTSPNKISELCKACEQLGIVEVLPGGKRIALFNLADFGLMVEEVANSE